MVNNMDTKKMIEKVVFGEGRTAFTLWLTDEGIKDNLGSVVSLGAALDAYRKYVEPNPHTKGTFAWAREELMRRRTVTCGCLHGEVINLPFHSNAIVSLDLVDATDWEVVS